MIKYAKIKKTIFLLSVLVLGGCSMPKETFDCKYGKGVGCRSITEVNAMVDQGDFSQQLSNNHRVKTSKELPVSIHEDLISADNLMVQRMTEEHLRIWLAPFEDEQGHFHEASIIHTVLRPGFWQVEEAF